MLRLENTVSTVTVIPLRGLSKNIQRDMSAYLSVTKLRADDTFLTGMK